MKTLLTLMLLIPTLSWAFFGPNNFNECRVEYTKKIKTELGAQHIARACNILFKKENPTSNEKKFAKCLIKQSPKQNTRSGQISVIRMCRDKYDID